jgi:hypothetical protein
VVVADADPAGIGAEVVHPIGDRLADLGIGEIMHLHPHRRTLGLPLAALVGQVAEDLLLLGVDADPGWPAPKWAVACWLTERNWPSRSGCWAPAVWLLVACSE